MGRDFFQDTAIGRVFHPRTRSFRQVCATDSAHVVVDANHRVSVHVDRVSPLLVKAGRCRYSIARAVAHNVHAGWEAVCRLVRRGHGADARCHLDCEIVWVPDDCDDEDEAA